MMECENCSKPVTQFNIRKGYKHITGTLLSDEQIYNDLGCCRDEVVAELESFYGINPFDANTSAVTAPNATTRI